MSKRLHEALLIAVAAPLLGVLMGGVYAWPAIGVTRGRDPWLTLLLAVGLATTVFGVGAIAGQPAGRLGVVLASAMAGLVAMRALFGSFDRNLERFGVVHTSTLLLLGIMVSMGRAGRL